MNEYIFPFDTCEKTDKHNIVAQPYSVFFNIVICATILFFLLQTRTYHSFFLLLSFLIFESFHTFSHIMHIPGNIQINITHVLAYFMNIAFFIVLYQYTNIFPSNIFILYLFLLVCLDIYLVFKTSFIYYLISMSMIFISLLLYFFIYLPKSIQNSIYYIISIVLIIISLFINEKINCKSMLSFYPDFPFHIFIEIMGVFLFYIICSNFYKL